MKKGKSKKIPDIQPLGMKIDMCRCLLQLQSTSCPGKTLGRTLCTAPKSQWKILHCALILQKSLAPQARRYDRCLLAVFQKCAGQFIASIHSPSRSS